MQEAGRRMPLGRASLALFRHDAIYPRHLADPHMAFTGLQRATVAGARCARLRL